MKIPSGSGAQAPSPAFGPSFCKVVSQTPSCAAEGTSTPSRESARRGPGGCGPCVPKRGLQAILGRAESEGTLRVPKCPCGRSKQRQECRCHKNLVISASNVHSSAWFRIGCFLDRDVVTVE